MTKEGFQEVARNSGLRAMGIMDDGSARPDAESAAWMQVKMLAEIAMQLHVMNERLAVGMRVIHGSVDCG